MKLVKITAEHYIIIDETIDIEENCFTYNKGKIVEVSYLGQDNGHRITHSTKPLESHYYEIGGGTRVFDKIKQVSIEEVHTLLGIIDIDDKAIAYASHNDSKGNINPEGYSEKQIGLLHGFIDGYALALEESKNKKFTEEEMIEWTMNMIGQYVQGNTNIWDRNLLKESLPKSIMEWEVEWEDIDNRTPCTCVCHRQPDVMHFVACCNDGFLGKIEHKLKLKVNE